MPANFQGVHQKYLTVSAEEIAAVEVTSCDLAKCLKGNMPACARARVCRGGRWRSEVRVHGCGVWSTWGRHSACLQVSVRVVYFCVCPCLSASGCFCVSGRVSVLDRGDFSPVGSGVRASEGACRCAGRACLSAVAVVPYKPEHVCRGVCAPVRACLLGHSSLFPNARECPCAALLP